VVLGKGAVQRGPGLGIDRLGQIEAAHFGPGMLGHRGDRVRHRILSLATGGYGEI